MSKQLGGTGCNRAVLLARLPDAVLVAEGLPADVVYLSGGLKTMAEALQHFIASRYDGRNLPVTLVLPDGARVPLSTEPMVDIAACSWRGLRALASPALGSLARAYVRGDLDFTGSAHRMLGIAESMVGSVSIGHDHVRAQLKSWLHRTRGNRRNVSHHYDVSNAFYRMWLDQRMVYSCAYYRNDADTLDAAQLQKLDHICRKLRLGAGERFLDIGCGWGALLFHAAERYGVEATGITLSQNQFDHVTREIAARGLSGRVHVELRDYLDLPEDSAFDKVASVGMFEHVGVRRFPEYFGKIYRVLKPGGLALNHGITLNSVDAPNLGSDISDFVEDYVFPGGQLTHVAHVMEGMARQGLEPVDAESLREHYARTLWHWVDRLEANADVARAEVGDERYRIWRIYMAGSAHAFDRGWLSLWQVLAGRPGSDGRLPHPLTLDYMYAA